MKITVTKKDLLLGERGNPRECPVALACRREIGQKCFVGIDGRLRFGNFIASLPDECCSFVDAFDRGEKVEPFVFDITIKCLRIAMMP